MKPMIDIKKLKEFQSELEKIRYEICEHATTDLYAMASDLQENCPDDCDCPYKRLCELLTCAKGRTIMMEQHPNNPNFTKG